MDLLSLEQICFAPLLFLARVPRKCLPRSHLFRIQFIRNLVGGLHPTELINSFHRVQFKVERGRQQIDQTVKAGTCRWGTYEHNFFYYSCTTQPLLPYFLLI